MPDTYFTADSHLFDRGVWNRRDVCKGAPLREKHELFIKRWNSVVKKGDDVHVLGDFALRMGMLQLAFAFHDEKWGDMQEAVDMTLDRLKGRKHLVIGNHDDKSCIKSDRWASVHGLRDLVIHGQAVTLCHYAMRVWNKSHYGSWMLYAHSHGNLPDIGGKTTDVGVDAHEPDPDSFLVPRHFEWVRDFMETRPVVYPGDHHKGRSPHGR